MQQYEPKEWRLFINNSKRSLKGVLLHNSNQFAYVPIAHSTSLKKKYEAVKYVLEKIGYDQHKWFICVDLKMVNFLLGQQSGFNKYPWFLCMWDSRDRAQHYTKDWPLQEELVPCKERNVINDPLMDRDRILFLLLHIKLGLIKQFTKALDKGCDYFTYLCQDFPGLTRESWKLASLMVLRSGSSSEIQSSKTQWTKRNWKRGRTETTQNLSTTCWLLSEPGQQHEHQPRFNEWRAGGEIPSGPERDRDQVSGAPGRSHDGWIQLESEQRPPSRWAFQEFEETEVQTLKFEQWWSNMHFTRTYLNRCFYQVINIRCWQKVFFS